MSKRFKRHLTDLRHNRHDNSHLQRSWKKYGQDAFALEELVTCEKHHLPVREQEFIDAYVVHGLMLFNLQPSWQSSAGFSRSDETRRKRSASMTERWKDNLFREKNVAGKLARYQEPGARTKHAAVQKLRWVNDDASRERARAVMKQRWQDPAYIAKQVGRKHSDETLAKMSNSHKARYVDPNERARTAAAMKLAYEQNPSIDMRKRANSIKRYSDPGERVKTSEAIRLWWKERKASLAILGGA